MIKLDSLIFYRNKASVLIYQYIERDKKNMRIFITFKSTYAHTHTSPIQ